MVDLNTFDIAASVGNPIIDLFDTMLSMKLQYAEEKDGGHTEGRRIVGCVSMTGRVKGNICIALSDVFARLMAASMHGVEIDEIEGFENIVGVIGEVCNVAGKNLKSQFSDAGLKCRLSPPAFISGKDFSIEHPGALRKERHVLNHQNHSIVVDVGLGAPDPPDGQIDDKKHTAPPMASIDLEKFGQVDIQPVLTSTMTELFDMMLAMDLEFEGQDPGARLEGWKIVGRVGIAGSLMGGINVHISRVLSRQMAAAMRGIDVEELEGDDGVNDVVSELCTIIGGKLASKFCDVDLWCEISTPVLTAGSDFILQSMEPLRFERYVFRHDDQKIIIEIDLRADQRNTQTDPPERRSETAALSQDQVDPPATRYCDENDHPPGSDHATGIQKDNPEASPESPMDAMDNLDQAEPVKGRQNFDMILDLPVEIVVEMGRTTLPIEKLLNLCKGSVVEFSSLTSEPVDLLINNKRIAKGKIVVEDEKYGIRITQTMTTLS